MQFQRSGVALFFLTLMSSGAYAVTATEQKILDRLEKLERDQAELRQQLHVKDQRIKELESQLALPSAPVTQTTSALPTVSSTTSASTTNTPSTVVSTTSATTQQSVVDAAAEQNALPEKETPEYYGDFTPGRGFSLAKTPYGSMDFTAFSYLRYLNQNGLDDTYTDSFGNVKNIDQRNDLQLQKVMLYFKGWVFDPKLRYLFYTWTSNTSQGDGAQVVVGGYMNYSFSEKFILGGGIYGLPSVRSMEGQWPSLLKVDYRTITDEYFRGSYTSGLFAQGTLAEGLQYKAMIGNNLSQLGVSAAQMDDTFNTYSLATWWMPTTGEYGPDQGFGDFEQHENFATRLGLHFTSSTEDKQSQPGKDDPENSQIRISDGTAIFDLNAFGPGTQIEQADYQMISFDAGFKYQGFALEGEYYWRTVDQFKYIGTLPFDELSDDGFQLQASYMLLPKSLQVYLSGSQINGEYGDPYDVSLGLNWFPYTGNRKIRVNTELLYLKDSPVGYTSVPFALGGNGTVFSTHFEFAF